MLLGTPCCQVELSTAGLYSKAFRFIVWKIKVLRGPHVGKRAYGRMNSGSSIALATASSKEQDVTSPGTRTVPPTETPTEHLYGHERASVVQCPFDGLPCWVRACVTPKIPVCRAGVLACTVMQDLHHRQEDIKGPSNDPFPQSFLLSVWGRGSLWRGGGGKP